MPDSRVTLKDIYDVAYRLEEKFDRKFGELDDRVEKLESFQNKALGIVGVFSSFISLAASYVWVKLMPK